MIRDLSRLEVELAVRSGDLQPVLDTDVILRAEIEKLRRELAAERARPCRCDELAEKLAEAERHQAQAEDSIGFYARGRLDAEAKAARLEAEVGRLRRAIEEAGPELHAALAQAIPSDDQIIVGHIRQAAQTLRVAS